MGAPFSHLFLLPSVVLNGLKKQALRVFDDVFYPTRTGQLNSLNGQTEG